MYYGISSSIIFFLDQGVDGALFVTFTDELVKEMCEDHPGTFAARVKLTNFLHRIKAEADKEGSKSSEFVTYEHFVSGYPTPAPKGSPSPSLRPQPHMSGSSSTRKVPTLPSPPQRVPQISPRASSRVDEECQLQVRGFKVALLKTDSLVASTVTGHFDEKKRNLVCRLQLRHLIGAIMEDEGAYRRPTKEEVSDLAVLFQQQYPAVGSVQVVHAVMKKRSYNDRYCYRKKAGLVGAKATLELVSDHDEEEKDADPDYEADSELETPKKKKKLTSKKKETSKKSHKSSHKGKQ